MGRKSNGVEQAFESPAVVALRLKSKEITDRLNDLCDEHSKLTKRRAQSAISKKIQALDREMESLRSKRLKIVGEIVAGVAPASDKDMARVLRGRGYLVTKLEGDVFYYM